MPDGDVDRLIRKLGLVGASSPPPLPPMETTFRGGSLFVDRSEQPVEEPGVPLVDDVIVEEPGVPDDDELSRQFRETLLEALGLGPSVLERLREPGIAGQALAAAQALKLQAPTHHGLNEQLKLVEGENKRALENAHGVLAAHFAQDGHALDLLKASAAEINRLLPALTLLPPYRGSRLLMTVCPAWALPVRGGRRLFSQSA